MLSKIANQLVFLSNIAILPVSLGKYEMFRVEE